MSTKDPAKARDRFLAAVRRITHGLELQRQRIVSRTADAPTLAVEAGREVIDLRGDPGSDIDYYVYELARLQDLARRDERGVRRSRRGGPRPCCL
jgi:hypothetical protein